MKQLELKSAFQYMMTRTPEEAKPTAPQNPFLHAEMNAKEEVLNKSILSIKREEKTSIPIDM